MDWLSAVTAAVQYIEAHLTEPITAEEIARAVYVSPFHFQRGFHLTCGCTVGEYIRGRRLYLAALSLSAGEEKIIDAALRWGYESPEGFSRAFRKFHGVSPVAVRRGKSFRTFAAYRVDLAEQGLPALQGRIEKMDPFPVFGLHRRFSEETAQREIPLYWEELLPRFPERQQKLPPGCILGKYGICVSDNGHADFAYWVAGDAAGPLPAEYDTFTVPALTWAKFGCTGPLSKTLQQTTARIFKEWLPQNPEWELSADIDIELYTEGGSESPDYYCEVWIPVQRNKGNPPDSLVASSSASQ